jgi:hypothetical protein
VGEQTAGVVLADEIEHFVGFLSVFLVAGRPVVGVQSLVGLRSLVRRRAAARIRAFFPDWFAHNR